MSAADEMRARVRGDMSVALRERVHAAADAMEHSPLYAKLLREAAAERQSDRVRDPPSGRARRTHALNRLPSRAVDRVSNVPPR